MNREGDRRRAHIVAGETGQDMRRVVMAESTLCQVLVIFHVGVERIKKPFEVPSHKVTKTKLFQ